MLKWLAVSSAIAISAFMVMPDRANAAGANSASVSEAGSLDVSAKRRYRRSHVRMTVQPAYRTSRRYRAPYIPHPFDLYAYRRPFFVPGPPPGVAGLRRDGMGTAAYGFGQN